MKRYKVIVGIFTFLLIYAAGGIYNWGRETVSLNQENIILVFPVISDIHIGGIMAEVKFEETLRDLKSLYKGYDALAIVGDVVDTSRKINYNSFNRILKKYTEYEMNILISMGNHEYYEGGLTDKEYEDRFKEKLGLKNLYYDKWIKGFHFIVLAPEHRESAKLSYEQLRWLETKLKENHDGKPMFIFLHQPFENTVFGSVGVGIENEEELYSILNEYPEAIFFSGHSHYDLSDKGNIYNNGSFTMINTGALHYILGEGEKRKPFYKTQGLIVEVYNSKVIVRRREFLIHRWIEEPYIIQTFH